MVDIVRYVLYNEAAQVKKENIKSEIWDSSCWLSVMFKKMLLYF